MIFFNDPDHILKEYYVYIINLLRQVKSIASMPLNIIIGNSQHEFENNNRTIIIHVNCEHTLVKKQGRNSFGPMGKIKVIDDDNDHYLVRIFNYDTLIRSDIVIDYSIPNLVNIKESEVFQEFYDKCIYIAPLLYPLYINRENRDIECLTTFLNTGEPRRKKLLENMINHGIQHRNVNDCFDRDCLQALYHRTRIMINIHQTDHHHTLEELRVLPALCSGILVICEESPLKDFVAYSPFLIWSHYDDMISTIQKVQENYSDYHRKIFDDPNFRDVMEKLQTDNRSNVENKIHGIFPQ